MKNIRNRKILSRLFFVTLGSIVILFGGIFFTKYLHDAIPNNIYLRHNASTIVDLHLPVTAETVSTKVDMNKPVTFVADQTGEYKLKIKLFGLFDVRTVNVSVVDKDYIYPCGFQIGLYMKTDGVLAVNTGDITDYEGNTVSPSQNIVQKGDYITSVNHEEIDSKVDLMNAVKKCDGNAVVMSVIRNDKNIDLSVQPVLDDSGEYKIGLWIKDDTQGIGTFTFIDKNNGFGALGHGISDAETSSLLKIKYGSIYNTKIISIVKGANGQPGEFIGTIDYRHENYLGKIDKNTDSGIFGTLESDLVGKYNLESIPIGYSYEVKEGPAKIRMYIDGEFKDYDIEITRIVNNNEKNITYKVTSPELLSITNGIVQGMSGCPIIQNEKIVGAVTHVFIDDSKSGYGIFIEKMLNNMK